MYIDVRSCILCGAVPAAPCLSYRGPDKLLHFIGLTFVEPPENGLPGLWASCLDYGCLILWIVREMGREDHCIVQLGEWRSGLTDWANMAPAVSQNRDWLARLRHLCRD